MDEKGKIDLGILYVVQDGAQDKVYLTHNNLLAFTVACELRRPARLMISKAFLSYSKEQWHEVSSVYLAWKRGHLPAFTLPRHSGGTKDGHRHPWRRH